LIERLVAIRKRAGLTAKDLGQRVNRGDCYISHVESGKYFPTVDVLEEIVKECGSSLSELFYTDFNSYKADMRLIDSVRIMDNEGKEALLRLFKILRDKADDAKVEEK